MTNPREPLCGICNDKGGKAACDACDRIDVRILSLLVAVCHMRGLQKAWFGGDKSRETLNSAKAAERRVDKLLEELDAPAPAQGSLKL